MYTLDPAIVESRLSIVKAFREADDDAEFLDVFTQNKPDLHALGALVQFHINVLYTQYLSIGLTYEEFYDDLIEWIERSGFKFRSEMIREYDRGENLMAIDIACALDAEYPFTEIMLTFQLMKGIK